MGYIDNKQNRTGKTYRPKWMNENISYKQFSVSFYVTNDLFPVIIVQLHETISTRRSRQWPFFFFFTALS